MHIPNHIIGNAIRSGGSGSTVLQCIMELMDREESVVRLVIHVRLHKVERLLLLLEPKALELHLIIIWA